MSDKPYDFGSDALGKALNEHVRLSRPFPRVFMVQPYKEIYPRTHKGDKPRSPKTNVFLIIKAAERMAERGDIQTVIWDGFTNTAQHVKNEIAQSGVNRDDTTKNLMTQWGEQKESILNLPGVNWRDNGMAQNFMRSNFRDAFLTSEQQFNFLCLGHEVLAEHVGEWGPDIAGPKGWNFAGGMFEGVLWVGKKEKRRLLVFDDLPRGAHTIKATFKKSPGVDMPPEGYYEIPDSYEGSVELLKELRDKQASEYVRWLIYGGFDGGKTALSSAFMGLDGSGTALVVMADQQLSLPTWWDESKQPEQGETKKVKNV